MEHYLFKFLKFVADQASLLWLLESYEWQALAGLAVVAVLCCLMGFYCYRALVSGMTFLCITSACFLWVEPAWGKQAAVTMCAVLGVALAFLAFRFHKLGAFLLMSVVGANLYWLLGGQAALSLQASLVLALLCAAAAGCFTFFFPFWGICGFTALWGGITFAMEGWRLLPIMPAQGNLSSSLLLGCAFAFVGLVLQLRLFRNQKLFARIMPARIEYALKKRRESKKEAVV